MIDDDISRTARDRRARVEAKRDAPEELARVSLADDYAWLVVAAGLVSSAGLALALGMLVGPGLGLTTMGVGFVASVVVSVFPEAFVVPIRMRALRRIGHGFDLAGYLAVLGAARPAGRLCVRLTFAGAWPEARRADVADAAQTWVRGLASARFEDDGRVLRLETAELRGSFPRGGGAWYSSNRMFVRSFGRIVRRVVRRLDREVAIVKIDVAA